jgi:thymidylate kinase
MTIVRSFLYLLDAISLRLVVSKALRSGADFIIFDRYAYDELANLNLKNMASRAYVRLIMSIVPRPDVSYILDADPVAARARKPEYPVEFLHSSRASYMTLSKLIGGMTIIPPLPIQEVKGMVVEAVLKEKPVRDVAVR